MIRENIFCWLPARFYPLPFSALLLVLTCCSYRAKELLVCWLLFCSFFSLLALVFLSVVLAFYAGRHLVQRLRAVNVNTLIPVLVARLAELSQEPILGPRLLTTWAFKLAVGLYPAVNLPDDDPRIRVEIASPLESDVPK